MNSTENRFIYLKNPLTIACLIASVKLLIYLASANAYGYFRDELYFLACTEHIALGYPDHAPLSIWIAKFSVVLFGDSRYAIHLFPALAGALKIVMTGFLVREFGGKHFAVFLACFCVLVAPVYLTIDSLMSMNAYDPIFWMGCVLSCVWAVRRGNPKFWLLFGAFAGLGLMNKHSMVFFGFALVVGLLLTQDRRVFAERYFWLGGLVAFLLFLPNLIWQYQNDWATLELLSNVRASGKNVVLPLHEFLLEQVLILLPLTFPVWFGGLLFLFFDNQGKRFRALGFAYLTTLAVMIALNAKHYYVAPVYPMLFAAGGVFWANALAQFRFGTVLKVGYPILILIGGVIIGLTALPVLPVEKLIVFRDKVGIAPKKTEVHHEGALPQIFGDMFGWEEMTERVAEVYNSLPADERARAAIFAGNYGEAGAIDHFGAKFGLPKAISAHQGYFLWGPRDFDGSVTIVLGRRKEDVEKRCGSVEEKIDVGHPLAMKEENFKILVCRDLKRPFSEIWSEIKVWK